MRRREFLKAMVAVNGAGLLGGLVSNLFIWSAQVQEVRLD